MDHYGLYKHIGSEMNLEIDPTYDIEVFTPSFMHPLFWLSEKYTYESSRKSLFAELTWALGSLWKYRIYYCRRGNEIVHITYCIYRCYKFPFLNRDECIYGPSYTKKAYRGQNLYPGTLQFLCAKENEENKTVYTIIRDENVASIRGGGIRLAL